MNNHKELVKRFFEKFLEPDYKTTFHTLSDLLWQILVNEVYKDERVCFYVDVTTEHNSLIIAYEIGGFKKTGIYFASDNYNESADICDELNKEVFGLTEEQSAKMLNISMLHNDNLE